jgi:hypothetical protein
MAVSRRRRLAQRISILLRRFDAANDDPIGVRVPTGERLRPMHLAIVAVALGVAGLVSLVAHGHLVLALILWFGALLFMVAARNPSAWR